MDLTSPSGPAALADALRTSSAAWVLGHGVPSELCGAVYAEALAFFELPREEKALVEWPGTGLWRGWQPVHEGGAEYGGDRGHTELLERYEINLSTATGGPDAPSNRWPQRPPGFRPAWTAYAHALGGLTARIVGMLADALDLPQRDVPAWTTGQFSNLVVNHYPAQVDPPPAGRTRAQPHVDHGGLTVLLLDEAAGGLEVDVDGEWLPAGRVPGALLVQAGELLERWTDGHVRPNRHRVVNPPRELAHTVRQSVLYFHHPDLDSVVTPAPSCRAGGLGLPPVVAGDLVAGRQRDYGLQQA